MKREHEIRNISVRLVRYNVGQLPVDVDKS